MRHWTLYDLDWNADGSHDDVAVEGEAAVFSFEATGYFERPAEALSRWVQAINGDEEAGFDYCDAHQGDYVIVDDIDLDRDALVVRHVRSEPAPGHRRLQRSVYEVRSKDGTEEVTLGPWGRLVEEVAR